MLGKRILLELSLLLAAAVAALAVASLCCSDWGLERAWAATVLSMMFFFGRLGRLLRPPPRSTARWREFLFHAIAGIAVFCLMLFVGLLVTGVVDWHMHPLLMVLAGRLRHIG